MDEVIGIDEETAIKLINEFNDALEESKKAGHFRYLYQLLEIPKHKIREQRYLCMHYGLFIKQNQIMRAIEDLM